MGPDLYGAASFYWTKWPSHHRHPRFPSEEHSTRAPTPAMATLRSSHKVGNTKPQARPFSALLSRIGQRSELAAPKYEDSTKLGIARTWGRWTAYVYPYPRRPRLSSWAEANKTPPGSVRNSTTSPTISHTHNGISQVPSSTVTTQGLYLRSHRSERVLLTSLESRVFRQSAAC